MQTRQARYADQTGRPVVSDVCGPHDYVSLRVFHVSGPLKYSWGARIGTYMHWPWCLRSYDVGTPSVRAVTMDHDILWNGSGLCHLPMFNFLMFGGGRLISWTMESCRTNAHNQNPWYRVLSWLSYR